MARVLILVEGQTEEQFIKVHLQTTLAKKGIYINPTILRTKTVKSGKYFKGGVISYAQVKRDLHNLFQDTNANLITTMFDLYGLPDDFPGRSSHEYKTQTDCYKRVEIIENSFREAICDNRFHPYLQLYEFEALLFSEPAKIAEISNEPEKLANKLNNIRSQFRTPEEIDDNPNTCPSRCILQIVPKYRKVHSGTIIAREIGLEKIRSECPHFNQWIKTLELLA